MGSELHKLLLEMQEVFDAGHEPHPEQVLRLMEIARNQNAALQALRAGLRIFYEISPPVEGNARTILNYLDEVLHSRGY